MKPFVCDHASMQTNVETFVRSVSKVIGVQVFGVTGLTPLLMGLCAGCETTLCLPIVKEMEARAEVNGRPSGNTAHGTINRNEEETHGRS